MEADSKWVVIFELHIYGPFDSKDRAEHWAGHAFGDDGWSAVELLKPKPAFSIIT